MIKIVSAQNILMRRCSISSVVQDSGVKQQPQERAHWKTCMTTSLTQLTSQVRSHFTNSLFVNTLKMSLQAWHSCTISPTDWPILMIIKGLLMQKADVWKHSDNQFIILIVSTCCWSSSWLDLSPVRWLKGHLKFSQGWIYVKHGLTIPVWHRLSWYYVVLHPHFHQSDPTEFEQCIERSDARQNCLPDQSWPLHYTACLVIVHNHAKMLMLPAP